MYTHTSWDILVLQSTQNLWSKWHFFVDSSLFPLIPREIAAMKNSTKLNQTLNIHIHNPSYPLVNIQKTIEHDHF